MWPIGWPDRRWQAIALRLIFITLLGFVTYKSLTPNLDPLFDRWSDKVLHIAAWLVLAIALGLAFPSVKPLWTSFLLLFVYSVAIELGQTLVPGRVFSGLDIVANALGCGVGFIAMLLYFKLFPAHDQDA